LNGLGAARSLGRAGTPLLTVALDPSELAIKSRYGPSLLIQDNNDPGEPLLEGLLAVARPSDVLLPTSDAFAIFISHYRERLEKYFRCCVASDDVLNRITDKAEETKLVEYLGVALPHTVHTLPDSPEELIAKLPLPIILKPRTSRLARSLRVKTNPVFTRDEVGGWYAQHGEHRSWFIAQELIPGGDGTQWEALCVFDGKHRLVSCFTFRKIRTAPPGFGVTCFAHSEWNPEIATICERIGVGLKYTGPADFDFKYDRRDRTYRYLETNPRLGMVNGFAAKCGVNSAYAAYRTALGLEVDDVGRQREGVYFIDLFDDLYGRLGGKKKSPDLLWRIGTEYLRLGLGKDVVYAYIDRADVAPGIQKVKDDIVSVFFSTGRKLMTRRKGHQEVRLDP
jgi:predicted ATP-grasp superfamily ATP-dependent carboligase